MEQKITSSENDSCNLEINEGDDNNDDDSDKSSSPPNSDVHNDSLRSQRNNVISSSLKQLSISRTKPYLFDALVQADKYVNTGISGIIMRTISVFRTQIADDTTVHDDISTRWKRFILLAICMSIAVPYVYWVELVPGLLSNSTSLYFLVFMTVINSTPFISWIVFMVMVVRKQNILTKMRLKLLNMSSITNEQDIPFNGLSQNEYDMLVGMVEEVKSLESLGKTGILEQQKENSKKWRNYLIISLIWTLILWILYAIWISLSIYKTTCNNSDDGNICLAFIIILLTSFVRFMVPILIVFTFVLGCDIVIQKINLWFNLHKGKVDIVNVCTLLEYNIRNRNRIATTWQWVFLTLFIIPLICMVLVFIATLKQSNIINNEWFFLVYCVHYTLLAYIAFQKASSIGSTSQSIRSRLNCPIAQGIVTFTNGEQQVRAYMQYLKDCYSGFVVFGITINDTLLKTFISLYIFILSWLADNVKTGS
jgi:hypothetical protein